MWLLPNKESSSSISLIMVRTRGLGRALGQVTGRGVGRGDHDDSDDAPQRRRSTASARRQRVAVTAAHNEPVVPTPDVQDDPMEASAAVEDIVVDIPANTGAEAAEDEHEGFSGGPSDPSECPELKLSSHGRKVHSLGRPVPAIQGLVAGTGLSPLIAHRQSGIFVRICRAVAPGDVYDLHAFEPLHVDDAVQMLVDLLMVSTESVRAEQPSVVDRTYTCNGYAGHWTTAARTYLLHLLGCTLFANKSATNVHVVYLEALRDLSMTKRYA
ncbi:hypothetical protein GmHk_04G011150 [Glycine max]|nr:hypothetical protein GmHk_04G011150 [Glycine max]